MTLAGASLRVRGLTSLDKVDLERQLASTTGELEAKFEEEPSAAGTHGELATFIAVVAISYAAIAAFSIWVCRRSRAEEYEQEIERFYPDGTVERYRIRIVRNSSDPPEAGVIKQIAAAFHLDEAKVLVALSRAGK
jgi:hypothetical protein